MSSRIIRILLAFLVIGGAAACSEDPEPGAGNGQTSEGDAGDLRSLDGPGFEDVTAETGGEDLPLSGEVCDNLTDDDNDTLADCDDPDCSAAVECEGGTGVEVCDDVADNDGDGRADCNDSDCTGDPACDPITPGDEVCNNSADDDDDGLVDCFDGDCATDAACGVSTAEDCANGTDDDDDAAVDCDDADCESFCAGGGTPGGNPDDLICLFLCLLDPTSAGSFGCDCGGGGGGVEANCTDTLDDDGDGMIDCDDFDCLLSGDPACS